MADAPGYRVLLRFVLAVAIGSVVFFGVLRIDIWVLKTIWADYAAAAPDRAYSLPMLLVRLVVFGSAIALASIAATRISALPRMPWIVGIVIFLRRSRIISIPGGSGSTIRPGTTTPISPRSCPSLRSPAGRSVPHYS